MWSLVTPQTSRGRHILCLGAHSDDIEIGCGGMILHMLQSCRKCHVTWVVFSARGERRREAVASAQRFLRDAHTRTIITKSFKESFFPYRGEDIKTFFEQLKSSTNPDLILTHYRHDLHQDHRVINELTWNTYRKHHILEYEIPKYDGDIGQPNVYVPLAQAVAETKVNYLMKGFSTQRNRQWFTEDAFYSLLRLRGIESNAPEKYAEAFHGRKIILAG